MLYFVDGTPYFASMSFLLACPHCGPREVHEFRYGGQVPPSDGAGSNQPGPQQERWYHRFGCRRWLIAERDVRTNQVLQTHWLDGEAS
jgi:sarcosine oxidase delta subunit